MDKLKIFLIGAFVFCLQQVNAQYTGGAYDGFDAGYSPVLNAFRVEGPLNGEAFCQGTDVEFTWSVTVAESVSFYLTGGAEDIMIQESVPAETNTITYTLPEALTDGVYSIAMISDQDPDLAARTRDFTVKVPVADLVGFGQRYYLDSDPVTLKGVPEGGDFSGAGVSGDQFSPGLAGVGSHEISYQYTSGQCVAETVTKTVEVLESVGSAALQPYTGGPYDGFGSASTGVLNQFSLDNPISNTCPGNQVDIHWTADAFEMLDILYTYNGGETFHIIAQEVEATAGEFVWYVPQDATEGQEYEIRIQASIDTTFFIKSNLFSIATPLASFGGIAERYYLSSDAILLSGKPDGGIFSGRGVVDNYFHPAEAGAGMHTLTYEYEKDGCVAPVVEKVVEVIADDPVARAAAYTGGAYDGFAVGTFRAADVSSIELASNPVFSLYENAPIGKIIGELSLLITNYNDSYTFTILDDDSQVLEVNESGSIQVKDPAWFDFESNENFSFNLRISNGFITKEVPLEITIKNLNERPSIASSIEQVNTPEGAADGLLASFETSDIDGDDLVLSIIKGDEDDHFYIEGNSLYAGPDLNFENKNLYSLAVMANDPGGLSDTVYLLVNVADVNETPVVASEIYQVAENSAVGTFVGQLDASDPEGSDLLYSILSGNVGDRFSINSQGQLEVKDAFLNYEDAPVYVLEIQVSDGVKGSTAQITVQLGDMNESPVFSKESYALVIAEDAIVGAEVGAVTAVDPDGDALSYSFVSGNGNGFFAIHDTGMITLAKAGLDAEAFNTYNLGVSISDGKLSTISTATITVENVNERPSLISVDLSVDENVDAGTVVGSLTAVDAEGDALTFSIISGNTEEALALDANSGQFTVNNPLVLDFETRTKLDLIVEVSDGSLSDQRSIAILIQDVQESRPPVAVAPNFEVYIPEGDPIVLEGYDPDGDEIAFEIISNPELGTLSGNSNEYSFTPASTLMPGEVYSDQLTFRVVETGGAQLASENATFKFKFGVEDEGHTITSLDFNDPTADTREFTMSWDDPQFNQEYTVELAYYDLTDPENPVFKSLTTSTVNLDDLPQNAQELSFAWTASASDHPYLFDGAQVFLTAEVSTATGYSDFTSFIISNNSNNGRVEVSEDGLFFAFGSKLTVRENRTVTIRFLAVELGDFDLSEASIELMNQPLHGTLSTPVLADATQNTLTWNATYTSTGQLAGTDSVQFRIIHPDRDVTDTAYTKIEIVGVNDAPKVQGVTTQTLREDERLTLPLSFEDPDNEVKVIVESNDMTKFPVSYSDGMISLAPDANFNGSASVNVIVQEVGTKEELVAFTRFNVSITAVNDAPVLTKIDDQRIDEDQKMVLNLSASDVDNPNQVFVYRAGVDKPSEVKFEIRGSTLEIIPEANVYGIYTVSVTADDQEGTQSSESIEESFTFEVEPVNDIPEVLKAFKTQNLLKDFPEYTVRLSAFFRDVEDGSALTYSSSGNENVMMTFEGDLLKISTASGFIGVEDVTITATDSEGAFIEQSVTFGVTEQSADVSVANPIGLVTLNEDFGTNSIDLSNVFALSGNASATFSHQVVGSNFIDAELQDDKLTLSSFQDFFGSETLYVIGTSDGKSGFTSFKLEILPVNDAPELSLIEPQIGQEDRKLSNIFVAVKDVDNTLGEISLSASSANQALVVDDKITFSETSGGYLMSIEPQLDQNGTALLDVMAFDGHENDATSFELSISPVNDAPLVAYPLEDQEVKQGFSWSYSVPDNTFTDVDADDIISTTITQYPEWATLSNGLLTGIPKYEDLGEYPLQVMATDQEGNTVTSEATVTVVFTAYNADVVLTTTQVCEGEEAVILASGAVDYNWYDVDGNLLQSGGNEYITTAQEALVISAEGLDVAGRAAQNRASITLNTFALPELAVALGGNTIEVTAIPGASYQWYKDGSRVKGAAENEYLAEESGEYTVKVITENGCVAISEAVIFEVLGLADDSDEIQLYPNPVTDWISVDWHQPINDVELVIYDAIGRAHQLPVDRSNKNSLKIDFSSASTGVFFIEMKISGKTFVRRIVKVR